MNRRNLFRLTLCALAASAMEVFGMKPISVSVVDEPVANAVLSTVDRAFLRESELMLAEWDKQTRLRLERNLEQDVTDVWEAKP